MGCAVFLWKNAKQMFTEEYYKPLRINCYWAIWSHRILSLKVRSYVNTANYIHEKHVGGKKATLSIKSFWKKMWKDIVDMLRFSHPLSATQPRLDSAPNWNQIFFSTQAWRCSMLLWGKIGSRTAGFSASFFQSIFNWRPT